MRKWRLKIINAIPPCRFLFFFINPFTLIYPPRHHVLRLSTCHPPIALPPSSSRLPIAFAICLSFSLTSIPINFCVGCLLSSPSINHSLCPSFIPETRMVFFQTDGTLSPFSLMAVKKRNYRFLMKGKNCTRRCCSTENHYRQINNQSWFEILWRATMPGCAGRMSEENGEGDGYTEKRKCCTLDVERVVNDKDSIPHHGEVDR